MVLNRLLLHIGHKLAEHVAPRVVRTNHDDLAAAGLANANAQLARSLPDHLRELASLDDAPRLNRERVLLDLFVPGPANVPRVGFGVPIGRPQTVQILAVLGVLTVREAVIPGEDLRPLLRIPEGFLV